MAKKKNSFDSGTPQKDSVLLEDAPAYGASGVARRPRFVDLFCGIGGFRYGFERNGCVCVFSSDWNEKAQETYAANFGERPHGDLCAIPLKDIPAHEILCAGFPCQPFSIAGVSKKVSLGRKHGFEDKEQGNLFFRLAEIIAHHKPDAFVLENVKNLCSHDKGNTFRVIYDTLTKKLGYTVHHKIVDAQSVVPQHRERIFLVGFRDKRSFEFPVFPTQGPKLETILEPEPPAKYTLTDHLWRYLQNYAAKHKAAGNGFGFGLVTGKDTTRTLSARYYKDGSEILIYQGPDKNPRRLTPRECALLMGYPKDFRIPVSDTQAYKQFGNSVVVPVVERIANSVVNILGKPIDYRPNLQLSEGKDAAKACPKPLGNYRIKSICRKPKHHES
ncbi:MAG: DNA (cytosine-5-)-methyltransferase [Verrucomicrobia bacterium]|nr:DNA (cytosine-5-)-methyltransferase [Verrucomicrobiota bacterium]